jgi:amidase
MEAHEYVAHDATGLGELVARGDVHPSDLLEAAIALVEKHNPILNGVIHEFYDIARTEVQGPLRDGPFKGVPLLLKDINALVAGVPTTQGSRYLADLVSAHDSELTVRLKRAGFVPFGKTNVPEFGILPTTEPAAYGPARNPWNPKHSTGGSSGGSAAMVAAGCVPLAHANDGGGSIRIPASACGLVGLKPTRGRNPLGPDMGDIMAGFVAEHVVSRTVRDTAAVLDATSGPDIGDPYWAPPPHRPYVEELGLPPGRQRIAFSTKDPQGRKLHPECVAAVENTAKLLADLGHEMVETEPELNVALMTHCFMTIYASASTALVQSTQMLTGREPAQQLFEPLTWAIVERGRSFSAADYQIAVAVLQQMSRHVARFFQTYPLFLTTTLTSPPLPIGELDGSSGDVDEVMGRAGDYIATALFNVTGQPAISLPLHWSADGLPVGVQIAGRFGEEGLLIRLAAQLEQARPWKKRRPPLFG